LLEAGKIFFIDAAIAVEDRIVQNRIEIELELGEKSQNEQRDTAPLRMPRVTLPAENKACEEN
jgi:hypothetical protein